MKARTGIRLLASDLDYTFRVGSDAGTSGTAAAASDGSTASAGTTASASNGDTSTPPAAGAGAGADSASGSSAGNTNTQNGSAPNLTSQSNLTPAQAASLWPSYEAIAAHTGVKIVGPQITWGTMAGYNDPVVWMDAFIAAYQAANSGRAPQIDYLAFHWYDYGLSGQLDRLAKYGKSFWITEFANWHSQADGAQIDTLAKQEAQMKDMVATCESRTDVVRYAWFTARWNNDVHFTSLLSTAGQLTDLGKLHLSLPYTEFTNP